MLPLTAVAPIFTLAPEHIVALLPALAAGSALVVIVLLDVSFDAFASVELFGLVVHALILLLPEEKAMEPSVTDVVPLAASEPVQL